MPNLPSFQDLLAEYAAEIFVGRSEHIALFDSALAISRPPFLILQISGQPGVGKTTLLGQFRRIAHNHEVLTALADESQTSVGTMLTHLVHQLGEAGLPFQTFEAAYRQCLELQAQLGADPTAPADSPDFAARTAARLGLRRPHRAPTSGDGAETRLLSEANELAVGQAKDFTAYVEARFTQPEARALLLQTDTELTRRFLSDLNQHLQGRRLILFFDSYKRTAPYLEGWMIDLLDGEFGALGGNLLIVIAGREPLGQRWTRFRKAIREIELPVFTEDEARDYLRRHDLKNEAQVAHWLQLTNRLPALLALLVSAPGDAATTMPDHVAEEFLRRLSPEQREAALVASVPHTFDDDILACLMGAEVAGPALAWLRQAQCVRAQGAGWVYHEVVRDRLLGHLRQHAPERCAELHHKLTGYFGAREEALNLPLSKCEADEAWRAYELERLYHKLSRNPPTHLHEAFRPLLNRLANHLGHQHLNGAAPHFESVGLPLEESLPLLRQVATETEEPTITAWADKLARFLHEDSPADQTGAIEFFDSLASFEALDNPERSLAFLVCGSACESSDLQKALDYCSKAIAL